MGLTVQGIDSSLNELAATAAAHGGSIPGRKYCPGGGCDSVTVQVHSARLTGGHWHALAVTRTQACPLDQTRIELLA
jgi:hypothetical protein